MHLYKNFFRLLKHNKTGVIIYGCIFVAMVTLLFLTAGSGGDGAGEFKKSYDISYVDHDGSELSKGLIAFLSEGNHVQDLGDRSEAAILDLVFFGMSVYHMDIAPGFADSINRGEDGKISYTTSFDMSSTVFGIDNTVNSYIALYRDYKLMGYSDAEAVNAAAELLGSGTEIKVLAADPAAEQDSNEFVVFQLNQFFCYLVLGFLALGVGHTIIANNDENVGRRIEASPVSRKKISFTNTLGLVTTGVVIWLFFVAVNVIFGHDTRLFQEYWWVIFINSFITMTVSCAIASLLTSFNINANSLSMVTNIVSLSMCFVCGVFVPQWLLGDGVLKAARFLPFYWSVYANNMTYPQSGVVFDLSRLMLSFLIQAVFAVVIALAAAFVKSSRLGKR